jgi:hypothetical protein
MKFINYSYLPSFPSVENVKVLQVVPFVRTQIFSTQGNLFPLLLHFSVFIVLETDLVRRQQVFFCDRVLVLGYSRIKKKNVNIYCLL